MFCCCCRRVHPLPHPLLPPLSATVSRHSLFVECFAHFLVERPNGKFNFKLRHEGCPVAGNEGEEWQVVEGEGGFHCEWAAALERVCPFRQVSKTVGQKTVWQLFNTIEYEVWQRQRSQSRNEVRWGTGEAKGVRREAAG